MKRNGNQYKADAMAVMQYFLLYCKAREEGFTETQEMLLGFINGLGMDVVDKDGKWCLVSKQITGKDRKED